ncbi:DNA-3-methyladenine glycosylase I [Rubripirellula reticaptiva]|uniref:DNA-3-methyladenine glycosylase 1 n=1 Tax=Rubripirellula reticaptiva TaxID=2528013 RepID=A0A5C6F8X9_9BACT|nr:DNA-3-methyladenine glycosylase I [Rubripirellula reticaptiva]TWU57848.1 DNA-3-methyladenine glycosylase 1 [Rubripirellula reticaptiva]
MMTNRRGTQIGDAAVDRCWWCGSDPQYIQYHDREWGVPVADDTRLFEKVCLEGFQAGLSWLTILRKRDSFREAFDGFDPQRVCRFDQAKVDQLVNNASIVRHRGKIRSAINNAARAIEVGEEFGSLATFLWSFEPKHHRSPKLRSDVNAITEESTNLSKALKKRGWTFVGPTTCFAMMQAMGMVNDHLRTCYCWERIEDARKTFVRP